MIDLEIECKTTPIWQKNRAAYESKYPVVCNEGGSRSGKT